MSLVLIVLVFDLGLGLGLVSSGLGLKNLVLFTSLEGGTNVDVRKVSARYVDLCI